jgi:hypothetical protein
VVGKAIVVGAGDAVEAMEGGDAERERTGQGSYERSWTRTANVEGDAEKDGADGEAKPEAVVKVEVGRGRGEGDLHSVTKIFMIAPSFSMSLKSLTCFLHSYTRTCEYPVYITRLVLCKERILDFG